MSSSTSAFFSTSPSSDEPQQEKHPGPLAGVKVLDLGQVVAGNLAGALLAYFGADVIKIEPPRGGGDPLRSLRVLDSTGTSLWWRSYGRNRRCVAADLRTEQGRAVARRLAASWADVIVENFRPGVLESFGLGPEQLGKEELIFVRVSGYGQDGPKVQREKRERGKRRLVAFLSSHRFSLERKRKKKSKLKNVFSCTLTNLFLASNVTTFSRPRSQATPPSARPRAASAPSTASLLLRRTKAKT